MSTTSVIAPTIAPTTPISRVRHAGRSIKHVLDEMVIAREVGSGRRR